MNVTLIDSQNAQGVPLREAWAYRELLGFLVWRDLKVRYRQTVLGAGWALLQPLATMTVFAVLFGRLLSVPSDGIPYPAFVLAGLVPWTYFATSVSSGATTLVGNHNLLAKVYFPRLLLPAAAVLTPCADAALALVLTVAVVAWFGVLPGLTLLALPLFALFVIVIAFGASTWLSALTMRYRDLRHVLPFAMQLWLFITPVAYPTSTVPAHWRTLYALNPMATVVDGFRWALLGARPPSAEMLLSSSAVTVVLAVGSMWYFRRVERTFADIV